MSLNKKDKIIRRVIIKTLSNTIKISLLSD